MIGGGGGGVGKFEGGPARRAAVKYIYREGEEAGAKPKNPRQWADCPLYEI
jgi:hypothetical protein